MQYWIIVNKEGQVLAVQDGSWSWESPGHVQMIRFYDRVSACVALTALPGILFKGTTGSVKYIQRVQAPGMRKSQNGSFLDVRGITGCKVEVER